MRSPIVSKRQPLTGKIYSISGHSNRLVVATSTRDILIFDIRYMSGPEQTRESPLRHQTRKVACDPVTGQSFTVGSVEVRHAVCSVVLSYIILYFHALVHITRSFVSVSLTFSLYHASSYPNYRGELQ